MIVEKKVGRKDGEKNTWKEARKEGIMRQTKEEREERRKEDRRKKERRHGEKNRKEK